MSEGSRRPELFEADEEETLKADADYEAWSAEREKELLADIESGIHLRCMVNAFDMIDRAMGRK